MTTRQKGRILLVDDDTSLLLTLGDFLKFEGYEVVTADSGEEGLRKLAEAIPDLIILDMSMPGIGGLGFLKAITPAGGRPRHPVLVLTARARMAESFGQVDVDGFIVKPCVPADLLMEVNRIVFLRRGPKTAPDTPAGSRPRRVLLGEDSDAVATALAEAIGTLPAAVVRVRNGPELLEKALMDLPDIVVVKTALGNMHGDALAEMLRGMAGTSGIPVVLYDASGGSIPDSRCLRPDGNIRKFVRSAGAQAIRDAVAEVLAGRPTLRA